MQTIDKKLLMHDIMSNIQKKNYKCLKPLIFKTFLKIKLLGSRGGVTHIDVINITYQFATELIKKLSGTYNYFR